MANSNSQHGGEAFNQTSKRSVGKDSKDGEQERKEQESGELVAPPALPPRSGKHKGGEVPPALPPRSSKKQGAAAAKPASKKVVTFGGID